VSNTIPKHKTPEPLPSLVLVELLTLTATQERRLGTLVVDVGPQILLQWNGRSLSLFDSLVYLSLGLFVEFLYRVSIVEHIVMIEVGE
jgi:hypothetical protein